MANESQTRGWAGLAWRWAGLNTLQAPVQFNAIYARANDGDAHRLTANYDGYVSTPKTYSAYTYSYTTQIPNSPDTYLFETKTSSLYCIKGFDEHSL